MNKSIFATTAGGALTALALIVPASALAAPAGVGSAQDTKNILESSGYRVVLNKVGSEPLDRCTVDSVRPGEIVTRPVGNGARDDVVDEIVYQTVYLTANC